LSKSYNFDYLIVGSGPGGTTAAKILLDNSNSEICIVEEGALETSKINMGTYDDLTKRYRFGGAEIAFGSPNISIAEGKTVGGGSEVNSGIYHHLSEELVNNWQKEFEINNFEYNSISDHISYVEKLLKISQSENQSIISKKIDIGAKKINKEAENTFQWIDRSKGKSTKQSMTEVFYKKNKTIKLFQNSRVKLIKFKSGTAITAICKNEEGEFQINFKNLILACGTIQSPVLLNNSGYKFNNEVSFNLHPHLKIAAQFKEAIESGELVSNYQIKLPEYSASIGASINSKQWKALMLLENWDEYSENNLSEQIDKIAVFYSMIKPTGSGKIRFLKPFKNYLLTYSYKEKDKENLYLSTSMLVKMLLSQDCEKLFLATSKLSPITKGKDLDRKIFLKLFNSLSLHSVHTFSSLRMGEKNSETDSYGKLKNTKNVFVADASIIPSPPGVNPQGIMMTLVSRNIMYSLENNLFQK
tara:strand:+ start:2041 stop:3456 length:1416 start_codon:yes stop_codon:yes gene_type:complete